MSDIERQITIRLKVEADKDAKSKVEAFKKDLVDSYTFGQKKFDDTERLKTQVFERESKRRIEIYRKEISATSKGSQQRAVNATANSRNQTGGQTGNPKSGNPGNPLEALDKQREKAYQKEALDQQKAIESLDKQRAKAYEKEVLDAQKAAEQKAKAEQKAADQKAKAEQRAIDSLDRQRSRALEKQYRDEENNHKRSEQALTSAREKQLAATKQVSSAALGVADNALVAAKGIAYLGLMGKESTQDLLDGLLLVEGGFNALRGGIGMFNSMRDAIEAVRKSVLATAAANELLAIAQKKAAVTGAVSAGVGAGSAIAGGGAAAAAGGVFSRMGSAAGRFASGAGRMAGRAVFNPLTAAIATGVGVGELASSQMSSDGKGTIGTGIEAYQTWRNNVRTGRKIGRQETERDQRREMMETANQRAIDQGSFNDERRSRKRDNLFRSISSSVNARTDLTDDKKQIEINRQMKIAAESELDQARAAYAKAEEDRLNRQRNHQAAIVGEQIAALNTLQQAAERKRSIEEDTLRLMSEQVQKSRQSVSAAQQSVQSAQDKYNSERENTDDKLASFARLSKGEQAQIEKIAKKAQSGEELSLYEVETLERNNLGQSIIRDQYKKKGKEAGGEAVLSSLGERDEEADAFLELQQAEASLVNQQMMLENAVNEEQKARERLAKAVNEAAEIQERQNQLNAQASGLEMNSDPANREADPRQVAFDVGSKVEDIGRTMVEALNGVNQQLVQVRERQAASNVV